MVIRLKGKVFNVAQTKSGLYVLGVLVPKIDGGADAVTVFTNSSVYKPGQDYSGDVNVYVKVVSELDVVFPKKQN